MLTQRASRRVRVYDELSEIWEQIEPEKHNELAQLVKQWIAGNSPESVTHQARPSETPEEFLKRHELDSEKWEVVRASEWSMTNAEGQAYANTAFRAEIRKDYAQKQAEKTIQSFFDTAIDAAKQDAPKIESSFPAIHTKKRTRTLHYAPYDHHLGKITYDRQGNETWNLSIASDNYLYAPRDIISEIKQPELIKEIVFAAGSDFYHYDNVGGTTTKGTQMEYQSKYETVYRRGLQLNVDVINYLRTIAPVRVVEVRGNHDWQSVFTIFEALECAFANTEDVAFERAVNGRAYHFDGYTLVGYTHGDDVALANLSGVMAVESAHFHKAKQREWITGHFHKEKLAVKKLAVYADHDKGVTKRIIKAMCGSDDWHSKKAYIASNPGTEAFLRCSEKGLINHLYRPSNFYNDI